VPNKHGREKIAIFDQSRAVSPVTLCGSWRPLNFGKLRSEKGKNRGVWARRLLPT